MAYPLQRPFLKPKGFCPNPVVTYGIPSYADSMVNKKVINTPAWREYWEEQIYYCINGYETAGVFIPGRYYHYLNFCKTSGVKGGGAYYPSYVDYQYEYFLLVEEAKRTRKNIVAPKGRRKGVSVVTTSIVDHGYRFTPNYKAGIAAGKKEYSEDFIKKWKFVDSLIVPELKIKKLSKNYEDIIAGWEQKDEYGNWDKMGSDNTLYVRTMFSDPEVFKGKYLNDVVYEESGEFDNLIKTIQATKPCIMDGSIQYGTMYIYGTGGNIKSGSKGFQDVWYNPDDYNCLKYFISGPKYYIPCVAGSTDGEGNNIEDIPNLMQYPEYQRVGMEDEVRALELIEARKAELIKSPDLTNYWEFCKDNPTDIKDVFRKAASNNFPVEILNNQAAEILSNDKKYSKYILEYETDESGSIKLPRRVVAMPAPQEADENECVLILDGAMPMPGYRNLDVAGIDSYDQDQSLTSSSLGAMVVVRRNSLVSGVNSMAPIALIRCRPSRKEKFYEMCMKLSIFYDVLDNTLIDVRCPAVIQYYKDAGCQMYLAKQPPEFQSENSELRHKYGASINAHSKPLMVSLLQSYYVDYGERIWFEDMIDEALNYDEVEKDSDNDTVDALALALMQNVSVNTPVINQKKLMLSDPYAYPEYTTDMRGNLVPTGMLDYKAIKNAPDKDLALIEMRMLAERIHTDEDEDEDDF